MVGITQLGAFSFISKLWTGSTSDTHITRESGLLDLLEEGDHAMTDRGFTIMDLLTKKVVLNIPLLNPPRPSSRSDFPFFRETLRNYRQGWQMCAIWHILPLNISNDPTSLLLYGWLKRESL